MTVIELYNKLAGMPHDAEVMMLGADFEEEAVIDVELVTVPATQYHTEYQKVVLS